MTLYKLTIASIKMYIRNKQALFWSLFFPVVIMVVFGLINFEGAGTNVDAHNFRYIDFLVPGVMALSIMQLGILVLRSRL